MYLLVYCSIVTLTRRYLYSANVEIAVLPSSEIMYVLCRASSKFRYRSYIPQNCKYLFLICALRNRIHHHYTLYHNLHRTPAELINARYNAWRGTYGTNAFDNIKYNHVYITVMNESR